MEWFENNQPVTAISADDRGAHYGDGLFETIALRDGKARLWPYHLDRLQVGCERLGIESPTADRLTELMNGAIAASSVDARYAVARLVVAAGGARRGYLRPSAESVVRVGLESAEPYPAEMYRDGVRVRCCNTRLAIQPQLAGIKTLNRLEQVLARAEWDDPDIAEGLTLDTEGRVICGTMSNVFISSNDRLATPALTRCGVAGVMRRHVLTELDRNGIAFEVRDIAGGELTKVDSIFLTNSQFGILPVTRYEERQLAVNDVVKQVFSIAAGSGIEECES